MVRKQNIWLVKPETDKTSVSGFALLLYWSNSDLVLTAAIKALLAMK